MKHLVLIAFCLAPSFSFCQQISWDELQEDGKRPKGAFYSYIDQNGGIYNAGTKLRIGRPSFGKSFTHIQEMVALNGVRPLGADMTGASTEIINFRVSGSKISGYKAWMKSKGHIGIVTYIIDFENAISTGELVGHGMTSDQALAELKKAKDKLDLQLITQSEFDSLKVELRKYIK